MVKLVGKLAVDAVDLGGSTSKFEVFRASGRTQEQSEILRVKLNVFAVIIFARASAQLGTAGGH